MVTVKFDNCGILTKMGDSTTHTGALIPPVDGIDFPHSGLIKLFDAQRYGYAILKDNITTGSDSSTAGSVFDKNFNISMDDTSSSGKTTVAVMSGAVIRNGILVNVATGASVGVGAHLTEITSGSPTDVQFIEQGSTGENFYHVIVVNSSNAIKIRNPSAKDKVADLLAGDIPIAILRVQNGETKTARHIQFLGTDRRDGGLSIYYTDSNVPTESLQISASSGHATLENKAQDKDIIFKVNDGGASTEVLRISGDDGYIGIGGITAPAAQLHMRSSVTQQPELRLENTNADAQEAVIRFMKNTASPAASDDIGLIRFEGENSAGGNHLYGYILGQMLDTTNTAEAGEILFFTGHKGGQYQVLAITGSSAGDGEVCINDGGRDDINFRVEGDNEQYLIFTDAANDRVAIGHSSPTALLDMETGGTFRNTRLLTVSVSASTTLTEAAHAGRYNICAGNITLPSTSTAGEHYAILNTTGGDITIGRNGNNINGAGSDATLGTFKAATCIAIGSNNWMVVGV